MNIIDVLPYETCCVENGQPYWWSSPTLVTSPCRTVLRLPGPLCLVWPRGPSSLDIQATSPTLGKVPMSCPWPTTKKASSLALHHVAHFHSCQALPLGNTVKTGTFLCPLPRVPVRLGSLIILPRCLAQALSSMPPMPPRLTFSFPLEF